MSNKDVDVIDFDDWVGEISFTPDPAGGIQMWVDGELIARGLDSDEIEQASSGRPLN
jgi:hypothetical protein